MKAAQIQKPGCIDIIEINKPEPAENQVRVKLEGCGVCGSNLPVYEGREWFKYPFTPGNPGHEGWGIVDAAGKNVKNLREGDRVTMLSYNAFAEYDVADENAVIKIPETLSDKAFPGEPLGCVMNIFHRSGIKEGETVAVIGIGFLGAMLTQLAVNSGAEVIAISRRDYSLELARNMGAKYTVKMDDHWRIIEQVKELTDGRFCSKVIEAVGMQWPLDLAGELTSERGRLIVAGYHQDGLRNVNMQLWNWRGIDVINAHEREQQVYINGIKDALEAVSVNILSPDKLYTEFNFEDIDKAFKTAIERPEGFVKAILNYN
jgi:threonine dehydrogenase-like Zn-dependent dehydrogenase